MSSRISLEGLGAVNWENPLTNVIPSQRNEVFLIRAKEIEENSAESLDFDNLEQSIEPYIQCGDCIRVSHANIASDIKSHYMAITERYQAEETTPSLEKGFLKILNNRLHFLSDLSETLQNDLLELGTKFNFTKDDIASIELVCLSGDLHHSGKIPVKITITLKSGDSVELVYKPRVMEFERRICDNQTGGIFHELNKRFHDKPFPEYTVHTNSKGTFQGYSRFIKGTVVADFETKVNNKPMGVTDTFLLNDACFRWEDYILIKRLHAELPYSAPLQRLVEHPDLLDDLEFCEQPDVKKLFERFPPKLLANVLKIPSRLECLQPNGLESLARKTFFYYRSVEQLRKDYLMFKVLEKLQVEDLHSENFILSDGDLVPIDLEVFGDSHSFNATHVLEMIELAFRAKDKAQFEAVQKEAQELDSLFSGSFSPLVEEFKKCIDETPQRFLPLTTEDFYQMRSDFLAEASIRNGCEKIFEKMRRMGFEMKETVESLEAELSKSFQQGDIPYFTICQGNIRLGNILIASKQKEERL